MSRISRDSKSKRDTKNSIIVSISGNTAKNFLTRYARQKNISACISRKLDQKYTISDSWSYRRRIINTVKSWIESATLLKIRHFTRDSNQVRIVFERGLYFLICSKFISNLVKNHIKLAVNSSKMMKYSQFDKSLLFITLQNQFFTL